MKITLKLGVAALAVAAAGAVAFTSQTHAQNAAQSQPATGGPGSPDVVTVNDPAGPPPNPANIPFVLPKDIKWTGRPGQSETANLYGNPNQPGPYAVLIKWYPGNFSRPGHRRRRRHRLCAAASCPDCRSEPAGQRRSGLAGCRHRQ